MIFVKLRVRVKVKVKSQKSKLDPEVGSVSINFLRDDPQFEALIMAAPFTTSKMSVSI